jgi:protein phosphatase
MLVTSAMHATTQAAAPTVDPRPRFSVRSFGLTDRGRVRPDNQDQFLIAELAKSMHVQQSSVAQASTQFGDDRGHLLVVADGIAGSAGGEHASALAVGSVEDFALNTLKWFFHHEGGEGQNVLIDLQTALRQADLLVFQEAASHPELRGMGTTLTMAYILGSTLFVIHVGDSRCYILRAGLLYQLTHDHTVAQELANQGIMTSEMAATHAYSHVITNAVGGSSPGLQAEVHKLAIGAGDVILLCSDGMTDMLADARIAEILRAETDPASACRRLVDEALAAGGRDNVTGIVARIAATPEPRSLSGVVAANA